MNPQSIAVFGGGWAVNVITQLQKANYPGDIWPVHPTRQEVLGLKCYADVASLPSAPDAAFLGVNRELTIEIIAQLSNAQAGGAICFASGFRETGSNHISNPDEPDYKSVSDDKIGEDLQNALLDAAGEMPLLGPNCYGLLNYLDNVTVWPDQHGGQTVESGVAIIAQSSNIAINMTMQQRGLPISYMLTVGNQAQISSSDLANYVLDDDRVTAIGLYIEGFQDIRALEEMAAKAKRLGKPIVAIKIGKSQKARAATFTHTASLAGGATASSALLARLGIVEVGSIEVFLETLKLLHGASSLASPRVTSVSCSGGEASLMADLAEDTQLEFADFSKLQLSTLGAVLGERVGLANPLDYHTYIWSDVPTMTACFTAVMSGDASLNVFVLDIPRDDICDPAGHDCAIEAIIQAKQASGAQAAVIATLPENMNEGVTQRFLSAGVIPLHGMQTAIAAIDAAISAGRLQQQPEALPVMQASSPAVSGFIDLDEQQAKTELSKFGLSIPRSIRAVNKDQAMSLVSGDDYPLVLKGLGIAHKSEAGAVILSIQDSVQLTAAFDKMPAQVAGFLLESMIAQGGAELIIGVSRDQLGLFVLTIGAGGILTELLNDTASLLLPAKRSEIQGAIESLKINRILQGFRGQPALDLQAVLDAIEAVMQYVNANQQHLQELDINPLIVQQDRAIAVDALIRLSK